MRIYSIKDLKDSRIFFDQTPPNFGMFLVGLVGIILVVALYASSIIVKPYIVKGQGTAVIEDRQFISLNTSGIIQEVLVEEGEKVEQGQPILYITNGQETLQIEATRAQLELAYNKIDVMNKFQKSIEESYNFMDNSGLEQEYYGYVEYYLQQAEIEEYSATQTNNKLLDVLNEEKNLINEISHIESRMSMSSNDEIIMLENQLEAIVEEKKIIEDEIKAIKEQQNHPSSQKEQAKSQLLIELGKSRTTIESQITELKANLDLYLKQKESLIIYSPNEGTIHYLSQVQIGLPVQQSQVIAEVSDKKVESLIIESYVDATDISKISLNDKVHVAISGVNTVKYGTLIGKVTSIDSGTITQESDTGIMVLYRIEVSIEKFELRNKNNTISLMSSMPIETRIVYEEETYLEWILEMINFKAI